MTEDRAILTGSVPVSTMRDYQVEVTAYTKGRGYLSCIFKGYEPCHNTEEVLEAIGYDSERDLANPTGSVFCAHGAGFVVPWDQVEEHMHLIDHAKKACETAGVTPLVLPIRGGTDGCQLSFKGLPCPNLGTGGHAFHGPYEHISVEGMEKSVELLLALIQEYTK